MQKEKLKKVIKSKLFLVGVGAFVLGVLIGSPHGSYVKGITPEEYSQLKAKLKTLKSDKDKIATENKDLQIKVDQAAPFFKMNKEDQLVMG